MSQYTTRPPCPRCGGTGRKVGILPDRMEECDHGAKEDYCAARGRMIAAWLDETHRAKEDAR